MISQKKNKQNNVPNSGNNVMIKLKYIIHFFIFILFYTYLPIENATWYTKKMVDYKLLSLIYYKQLTYIGTTNVKQ